MTQKRSMSVLRGLSGMVAAGVAVVVIEGCTYPGLRFLRMEVYQDEQLVLRTTFDAPDYEGPGELWRRAGSEPFGSEEAAPIAAQTDDPLRARLVGSVQIKIIHNDRVMTSASLANLELVRNASENPKWYLPAAEVARARRAAGF